MSRKLSFWLLVGAIAILCVVFYRVMASFLVPLFLAALLVVIFGPLHRWILDKLNGRSRTAAALTTAIVMLSVLVPFLLIGLLAANEGRDLLAQMDFVSLKQKASQVRTGMNLNIEYAEEIRALDKPVAELLRHSSDDPQSQMFSVVNINDANLRLCRAVADKSDIQDPDDLQKAFAQKEARFENAWEGYLKSFMKIVDHLKQEDDQAVEDDLPIESYQSLVLDFAHQHREFRSVMIGGLAKELANPTDEELEGYLDKINLFLQKHIFSIGGAMTAFVGKIIIGIAIMVIALYFFLLDGPGMIKAFKFLSPLNDAHEQELLDEFGRVSRAVMLATLLSAIAQGLLAGIGFYFAGLDSIFLLMLLSTTLALVPFVGAASVWVPCCLWLYLVDGRMAAAIMLAIYGVAVISMIDNLIKPFVLHGQSNLHPLLALLSVLGGVTALGPVGILVGPMVVAFLQTLLKILQRELSLMDRKETVDESNVVSESAS